MRRRWAASPAFRAHPCEEALLQLASIGLVESRPRQSATVATLSVSAIIESFEFNVELESITARMAARRMTSEERATLDSLVKRMRRVVEQKDVDQYVVLNRDFHEKLYAASHNRYVHAQARSIFARLAPYRRQVRWSAGTTRCVPAAARAYRGGGLTCDPRRPIRRCESIRV